jgi:hypothetical protein
MNFYHLRLKILTSWEENKFFLLCTVCQGIGPRVLWIGIGGSIFFGVLERTKRLLAQRRPISDQQPNPKQDWSLTRVAWNPWQLCHVDFRVQCQSMHLEIAWEYCPWHELHQNQLKGDLIRDCQPLGRLNHQYYKEKLFIRILEKKLINQKQKKAVHLHPFCIPELGICKWGLNVVIYPMSFRREHSSWKAKHLIKIEY